MTPGPADAADAADAHVELLAAALRRDAQDLSLYAGFLLTTLSVSLPPDLVTVTRHRTLRERMSGAEGAVTGVTVRLGDRTFSLVRSGVGARPSATVSHEVNGIVLSTQPMALDAWSRAVAEALVAQAQVSAGAAAALEQMLRPGAL